jgi:hypothetical protein
MNLTLVSFFTDYDYRKTHWPIFDGRSRRMNLGEYPAVSPVEARKKAEDALLDIQRGIVTRR